MGGPLVRLGGEETELDSTDRCLGAIRDLQLANYALHVGLHGQGAHDESLRDLLVGLPTGQQAQHFKLPLRQRVGERIRAFAALSVWGRVRPFGAVVD